MLNAVRDELSQKKTPIEVFDEITFETDLLQVVRQVFEMNDETEEIKEMKDLACEFCVNIATGSEKSIN